MPFAHSQAKFWHQYKTLDLHGDSILPDNSDDRPAKPKRRQSFDSQAGENADADEGYDVSALTNEGDDEPLRFLDDDTRPLPTVFSGKPVTVEVELQDIAPEESESEGPSDYESDYAQVPSKKNQTKHTPIPNKSDQKEDGSKPKPKSGKRKRVSDEKKAQSLREVQLNPPSRTTVIWVAHQNSQVRANPTHWARCIVPADRYGKWYFEYEGIEGQRHIGTGMDYAKCVKQKIPFGQAVNGTSHLKVQEPAVFNHLGLTMLDVDKDYMWCIMNREPTELPQPKRRKTQ